MQLEVELHKLITKNWSIFSFRDNILGADLQVISKYNNWNCFWLCVIDTFNKYAWVWVVPMKDKKCITNANHFQTILKWV